MNIRLDDSIPARLVIDMAAAVGGRIEYRGGDICITRRPPTAVALAHYNRVLEQARREVAP